MQAAFRIKKRVSSEQAAWGCPVTGPSAVWIAFAPWRSQDVSQPSCRMHFSRTVCWVTVLREGPVNLGEDSEAKQNFILSSHVSRDVKGKHGSLWSSIEPNEVWHSFSWLPLKSPTQPECHLKNRPDDVAWIKSQATPYTSVPTPHLGFDNHSCFWLCLEQKCHFFQCAAASLTIFTCLSTGSTSHSLWHCFPPCWCGSALAALRASLLHQLSAQILPPQRRPSLAFHVEITPPQPHPWSSSITLTWFYSIQVIFQYQKLSYCPCSDTTLSDTPKPRFLWMSNQLIYVKLREWAWHTVGPGQLLLLLLL